MVWAFKVTGNEMDRQLAAYRCYPLFMVYRPFRVLRPSSRKSPGIHRERGTFFPDAIESGSGSDHADHLYYLLHAFLQRCHLPVESSGCLRLPGVGGLLCVYEIMEL